MIQIICDIICDINVFIALHYSHMIPHMMSQILTMILYSYPFLRCVIWWNKYDSILYDIIEKCNGMYNIALFPAQAPKQTTCFIDDFNKLAWWWWCTVPSLCYYKHRVQVKICDDPENAHYLHYMDHTYYIDYVNQVLD